MTYIRKGITALAIFSTIGLLVSSGGCKKDDPDPPVPPRTTTYNLMVKDVLGVTGTAKVTESSATTAIIDLTLNGAPAGSHPAYLCLNTVVEGGPVIVALNPVDATGKSTTAITALNYSQVIVHNAFIKVVQSSAEPNIILAQGDIGGNVITATNVTRSLDTIGVYNVSGTALFEKRVNGSTLLTISLNGLLPGDMYPATINLGSITSIGGGPVVKVLSMVDGTNGKSYTNIRQLESGVVIGYDDWLVYDGYINIYQSSIGLANIIAHGNIGSN